MRAQRSNPDCTYGGTLDCFAALAMTMWRQSRLLHSRLTRNPRCARIPAPQAERGEGQYRSSPTNLLSSEVTHEGLCLWP
ncbi:hypothetical protein FXV83_14365 [Bradyrhizobium hipponense]|uniref:Uncharacterized protein n=1 Tax=Bradyrhizobium hipponense TaxID=2605638 RepID=A0A5S4YX01_9BRAD|nr:hypothetical protein FXV83_14365 [Bradyrhizobium hipponense]